MTKKQGSLIGTLPELRKALAPVADAYPALRWCDGDQLVAGVDDLRKHVGDTETLFVDLDGDLSFAKGETARRFAHNVAEDFEFAADPDACLALAKKIYGPPKPAAMITLKWLKAQCACAEGQAWFVKNFGETGAVSRKALETLLENENAAWLDWLRDRPN